MTRIADQQHTLQSLIEAALQDGWSSTTALNWRTRSLEQQIRGLHYELTSGGRGSLAMEVLTPTTKAHAHPRSLSAIYGLGQQPLHTDGAHREEPPEVILLAAQNPSEVPTLLWSLPARPPDDVVDDLRHGLFNVHTGQLTFLASALVGYGSRMEVRFDPGCMTPADGRARRAARFFDACATDAVTFAWDRPEIVLAIDNRRVLHARADASAEPDRHMERLALRLSKEVT